MPISGLIAGRMGEAFQDLLAQRFAEEERREQQRQREFENSIRLQQIEEAKAEREAARAYRERTEKRDIEREKYERTGKTLANLQLTFDPTTGAPLVVPPELAAATAGTEFAPLIEERQIPAGLTSDEMEAEVIPARTQAQLRKTAAMRTAEEAAAQKRRTEAAAQELIPTLSPEAQRLGRLGGPEALIKGGAAGLKTTAELEAEHKQELKDYAEKQEIAAKTQAKYRPPVDTSGLTAGRSRLLGQSRLLQNDYQRDVQGVTQMARAYEIMQEGLKAVKEGRGPAGGAQAVLVTFQKTLDPTSVVRESEYMRSAAGQSLADRLYGQIEQWRVGGAGVPVHELENFVDLAGRFTQRAVDSAKKTRQRYINQAETFGIDPDFVVGDMPSVGEEGAGEAGGAPSAGYERYKQRKGRGQ